MSLLGPTGHHWRHHSIEDPPSGEYHLRHVPINPVVLQLDPQEPSGGSLATLMPQEETHVHFPPSTEVSSPPLESQHQDNSQVDVGVREADFIAFSVRTDAFRLPGPQCSSSFRNLHPAKFQLVRRGTAVNPHYSRRLKEQ